MRRRLVTATIAAYFSGLAHTVVCSAGVLTYSWSGQLKPNVTSVNPWSLGAGRPFALSVTVQDNASDAFPLNSEFAGFDIESVQLTIDGTLAEYVTGGEIDLTDNHQGSYDLLTFEGTFRLQGQSLDVGMGVTLPIGTFSFPALVVPPPFFVSTTNAWATSVSPPGPYTGIVKVGELVIAVPEPAMISFASIMIAALICGRRHLAPYRRRRRRLSIREGSRW